MDTNMREVLEGVRRGRGLAGICTPDPGQTWFCRVGNGVTGTAVLIAAMWADRFGSKVWIDENIDGGVSPQTKKIFSGAADAGLVKQLTLGRQLPPNHICIRSNGIACILETIPDEKSSWGLPFSSRKGNMFVRPVGRSTPFLAAKAIRELDRICVDDLGIPEICLMENAGMGVISVALSMLGKSRSRNVTIMVGGGNNGGDGLVAARGLSFMGVRVTVALLKPESGMRGSSRVNLEMLRENGTCRLLPVAGDAKAVSSAIEGADIIIDAMTGIGLKGGLGDFEQAVVKRLNDAKTPILSVDIPSGLDADSGRPMPVAVKATATVTFAAQKTGLGAAAAAEYAGQVYVAEIGAPRSALDRAFGRA